MLQNRELVTQVLAICSTLKPDSVLDLYCGIGNFSLPVARQTGKVVGLESFSPSIERARENSRRNGIANAEFICEDSAVGVERLAAAGERFDLVILDPPRSGALDLVKSLHRLKPKQIIYISCDPATLGRDLAVLQKDGFKVLQVQPLDMFPQTCHLESVALLESVAAYY
jgi:23S rRNA (uracil1939-C5)-methyltransferase